MAQKISHINPFGLRMPDDIKNWVSNEAQKNERSMNWVINKIIKNAKSEKDAQAKGNC